MKFFVECRRGPFQWLFAFGHFSGRTRLVVCGLMVSAGVERD